MARNSAVLALVAVLATLLAACGSKSGGTHLSLEVKPSPIAARAVHKAATHAQQAPSMKFDIETRIRIDDQSVEIHIAGASDTRTNSFQADFEAPSQDLSFHMVGRQNTFYMQRDGTTTWTKVELDPSIVAKFRGQYEQAGSQLAWLKSISSDFGRMGTATLEGDRTTHYGANVDWSKLKEMVEQQGTVNASDLAAVEDADPSGTVEAYVDQTGQIRRMNFRMALGDDDHDMQMSVDLNTHDLGQPVQITLPSDSDVLHTVEADTMDEAGAAVQELVS